MDREWLVRHWDEAWTEGLWAVPWSRVLDDLTPEQAVWSPDSQRHCIWQHLNHMLFWREVALNALAGKKMCAEEKTRRNFESPEASTSGKLDELRTRWEQSFHEVRAAIADERHALAQLQYIAYHDNYHVGQVMLLRAMQGLPPIE